MSKSDPGNCLFLIDEPELIDRKLLKAKTDSFEGISYDRLSRKALSNLIEILSLLRGVKIEVLVQELKDLDHFQFKKLLSKEISDYFSKFRDKYKTISENTVTEVLKEGTASASKLASLKLNSFLESINK